MIQDPLERRLVATADAGLTVAAALRRPLRGSPDSTAQTRPPARILLLRLERIGDLVMALPAIRDVRALAPDAQIDLVVGSWNAPLARAVPNVDRVETLDARWLAREREGVGLGGLLRTAWTWRPRRYNLAINFEPDIRSNLILAAAGAAYAAGWRSGGGGPMLDLALDYDIGAHTAANARRLVAETFGRRPPESARPLLAVPDAAAANAAVRLRPAMTGQPGPLVGIHVSGGRAIKQWDPRRFADVARRLVETRGATIVATGAPADRPLVDGLRQALAPHPVIDAAGGDDLLEAAAVLARLDVLVTGDTGPMHLASAVGTPVVAVFGPSDPARYGTAGALDRIVRIDLPCSPCNRIRQPPARCTGHMPDCLSGIDANSVYEAAAAVQRRGPDTPAARRPFMSGAFLQYGAGGARREVRLDDYLDPESVERATADALAWIKRLRHAEVDGQTLRQRFTCRGDSLWWFAELYLHKQQVVLQIFRSIAALDAFVARERPGAWQWVRGPAVTREIADAFAAARGVNRTGRTARRSSTIALAAMEAKAGSLHASALASRLRMRAAPARPHPAKAAVFVHRAFWRGDSGEGSAESYIGPVLSALEGRLERDAIAYVSVGPSANFRARRWWHPLRSDRAAAVTAPIEAYAPLSALRASRRVWRERHQTRRALWKSRDLRDLAVIHGCDCWPILQRELAGVALLQFPWSARAMDEAGAALDALAPRAAVTYAEAGGWGRAIVLECRRRGIPSVGLQHGFIYRHWLNYLHEPDEMTTDPQQHGDGGFPHPTLTALFDGYAAEHLANAGHFPAASLEVTGSPRLDALAAETAALTPDDVARARAAAGAGRHLVVVTTKQREAERVLPVLLDAAAALPDVHVAIKTHPAETPDVYAAAVAGRSHVSVLDASAPLAPLLRGCRAVVTVNSTVALDAAVLDVPALALALPNNLSPFVEAGVLAGAGSEAAPIRRALEQILYDEEFRAALARARRTFLTRYAIAADGRAAERAAGAVVRLIERSSGG